MERDTAQEESEPEKDTSEEEERLPFQQRFSDPQNIVSALEWICLRVTHMKRRADWLTWLSESSILFEPVGRPESRRLLIIQAGEIASTRDVSPGQPLPAPPGHLLSADQRRLGFDQPMYDRLRVLTTELRRILKDRRTLQVRFGPRRRFSGSGLERRLSWL